MTNRYPTPDDIAQTIRHSATSLKGATRFYGSAGAAIYAYDRTGLANVASRVWLPPGVTRRLSTYLDIVTPGVGGFVMQPAGLQPPQLDGIKALSASTRLREIAESKHQVSVGKHGAAVCSVEDSPDPGWEWSALLAYDHRFRLKSGQYTMSRPLATFHVRGDQDPTRAHIVVEIHHKEDMDRVREWMVAVLPSAERWSVIPFGLLEDRHREIRAVVAAISEGGEITVANALNEKVELTHDADIAEFVHHLNHATYGTSIQSLESIIERAETVDYAVLTAFDFYHWHGADKKRVAVRIRLTQSGMNPLTLTWGAVRELYTAAGLPITQNVKLDAEGWDLLTSANWDDDQRMAHLRLLWSRVLRSIEASASDSAAA